MYTIKTVVLTHEECHVIYKAARFINIIYPLASDPLVPEGEGVDERHPGRRALNINAMETVTYDRLHLAQQTLTALQEQITRESSVDHWLSLTETPDDETSRNMANALAAERGGQQRLIRDALEVVDQALVGLDPEGDSFARIQRQKWGGDEREDAAT